MTDIEEIAFVHPEHGPCPFCRGYEQHESDCDHSNMDMDQIMAWWDEHGEFVNVSICSRDGRGRAMKFPDQIA
jgi:hypothetical protein